MTDTRTAYQAVCTRIEEVKTRMAGIADLVLARIACGMGHESFHAGMYNELKQELDMLHAVRDLAASRIERPHTAETIIDAAKRAVPVSVKR